MAKYRVETTEGVYEIETEESAGTSPSIGTPDDQAAAGLLAKQGLSAPASPGDVKGYNKNLRMPARVLSPDDTPITPSRIPQHSGGGGIDFGPTLTGGARMVQGGKRIAKAKSLDDAAGGTAEVLAGGFEAATPAMVGPAIAHPIRTGLSLGAGMLAQNKAQEISRDMGLGEGTSDLIGVGTGGVVGGLAYGATAPAGRAAFKGAYKGAKAEATEPTTWGMHHVEVPRVFRDALAGSAIGALLGGQPGAAMGATALVGRTLAKGAIRGAREGLADYRAQERSRNPTPRSPAWESGPGPTDAPPSDLSPIQSPGLPSGRTPGPRLVSDALPPRTPAWESGPGPARMLEQPPAPVDPIQPTSLPSGRRIPTPEERLAAAERPALPPRTEAPTPAADGSPALPPREAGGTAPNAPDLPADPTGGQFTGIRQAVHGLAAELGLSHPDITATAKAKFGTESTKDLTFKQWQDLYKDWAGGEEWAPGKDHSKTIKIAELLDKVDYDPAEIGKVSEDQWGQLALTMGLKTVSKAMRRKIAEKMQQLRDSRSNTITSPELAPDTLETPYPPGGGNLPPR
jgi:hypothetical protein